MRPEASPDILQGSRPTRIPVSMVKRSDDTCLSSCGRSRASAHFFSLLRLTLPPLALPWAWLMMTFLDGIKMSLPAAVSHANYIVCRTDGEKQLAIDFF